MAASKLHNDWRLVPLLSGPTVHSLIYTVTRLYRRIKHRKVCRKTRRWPRLFHTLRVVSFAGNDNLEFIILLLKRT